MSELRVNTLDVETLNVGNIIMETLTANTVNANSVTVSGNVSADRYIVTGPSGFQFIERMTLTNVEMANTSNISGYSSLRWSIEGLIPANTSTSGPRPMIQVSTDGTNYANVNNYLSHVSSSNGASLGGGSSSRDDSNGTFVLSRFGVSNLSNSGGGSGTVYLWGNKPGVTTRLQSVFDYRSGEIDSGSPWNYQDRGYGRILLPDKITNYRIRFTEGSAIANGVIIVEGIPG